MGPSPGRDRETSRCSKGVSASGSGYTDPDLDYTWKLIAEVQSMTRVDSMHVVRAFDMGDHQGSLYAALELCDGNLEDWRAGKAWAEVLDRLIEAGRGLAAVHAAGLVHGDVKPENIFLKDGVAKLGDFGLATRPGWSTRISGTAGYIAPEVADGRQSFAGDVFAFACTAWLCLVGAHPFGEAPTTADSSAATLVLIERAREGELHEAKTDVPAALAVALRAALQPEPEQRPSLAELLARLSAPPPRRWHAWRRARRPR